MDAAFKMFTRTILHHLMVAECMRADDPVKEVAYKRNIILAAADTLLSEKVDELSHASLEEHETFWRGVEAGVRERVLRNF